MNVEEYALQHQRLHPTAIEFLQKYFDIDLRRVKVNAKHGRTGYLNVPAWVLFGRIMVQKGMLNKTGNRAIDLATNQGMKILAHECYHVQQWLTRPWWKMLSMFAGDVFRSLRKSRSLWRHAHSKLEQEAITFTNSIASDVYARIDELKVFEELR